jgi:hypothetical protein
VSSQARDRDRASRPIEAFGHAASSGNSQRHFLHRPASTNLTREIGSENGHLIVLGLDVKDFRTPTSYEGHEEVVELLHNNGANSFDADYK